MSSSMLRRAVLVMLFLAASLSLHAQQAQQRSQLDYSVITNQRPRLVVVISIDQFRADYLRRLTDLFLPPIPALHRHGGFRYLMGAGANFLNARYGHFPLTTGPGHAVILTGGYPYKTGIVSNAWLEQGSGKPIYCVDDSLHPLVGVEGKHGGIGPLNLRSTTVGDELKLATGRRAKVVSLALKDRAAVLLGGHMQDACIWFDDASGHWISSTAYCRDERLPAWVDSINAEAIPERTIGTTWQLGLTAEGRARAIDYTIPPARTIPDFGASFPHAITAGKSRRFQNFVLSPDANDFVFTTAMRAVAAEGLGQDSIPDLLAINLSTNDYIGHAFGPYSPEAIDLTVRTDEQLGRFLDFLDRSVRGGLDNVIFVITADHGVAPVPESAEEFGIRAGRISDRKLDTVTWKTLEDLGITPGAAERTSGFVEPYIYVGDSVMSAIVRDGHAGSPTEVEEKIAAAAARIPGIYACYTRTQIEHGELPRTDMARNIANGFHPQVSGDVVVVMEPNYINGGAVATHGMPYVYDMHVPLLISGFGIRSGSFVDPVSPADIAPTLCTLLGIEFPSACDGQPLRSALK
jgi:predicted AlkP superfamily pyrophosphatase or phosphodiesterase